MDISASPVFENTAAIFAKCEAFIGQSFGLVCVVGAVAVLCVILLLWPPPVKVPVVTVWGSFFPDVVGKWAFMFNAPPLILRGYEKVRSALDPRNIYVEPGT
jgi:hypothetical protein